MNNREVSNTNCNQGNSLNFEDEEDIGIFDNNDNFNGEMLNINTNVDFNYAENDIDLIQTLQLNKDNEYTPIPIPKPEEKRRRSTKKTEQNTTTTKLLDKKRKRTSYLDELQQNEKAILEAKRKKRKAAIAKKWRDNQKNDLEELENEVKDLRLKQQQLNYSNNTQPNLNGFLLHTLPNNLKFIGNALYSNIPFNQKSLLSHIEQVQLGLNKKKIGSDMVVTLYIEQVKDLLKGFEELVQLKEKGNK